MLVYIYPGGLNLVKKSGVGEAIFHQKEMLEAAGVNVTLQWSNDADVVHLNTTFPDSCRMAHYAHSKGKSVIYYGHSTMEDFRNSFTGSNTLAPLFQKWIIHCYSMGDIVITPTEYSRSLLQSYGIKRPIFNLSNGIDTILFSYNEKRREAFRNYWGLNSQQKAVLSVGHFIERKGILDYIDLARRMPDVRFFWFGHTEDWLVPSQIRKAIKNTPPNLTWAGYVPSDRLCDAYCGCDLFDFMSYEETEGIVVLEALACHIPVIVRDIPVYGGWLENGVNVWKAKDDAEFFQKTKSILSGELPDLTEKGHEVAENRSISKVGKRLLEIYEALPKVRHE